MSRLDRHVTMVRNKLALGRFISALAWAGIVYAAGVWIGILVDRIFLIRPPHLSWVLLGAAGLGVLAALAYAIVRRPSEHDAAVAIDEKLLLKEKFSTALYARPLKDPFAQAAVKDAEQAAENVSLHKRFPLEFPRQSIGALGVGVLVVLTMAFVPRMDLFGREASHQKKLAQQQEVTAAKKAVAQALQVVVQTEAKGVADEDVIKQARKELEPLINGPIRDPQKAKRSAARALEDVNESIKAQMANNQRIANAENDARAFKSLTPAADEKGPVADAQRKIAKGDFADAVDELQKAVKNFDKMNEQEKKAATTQMAKMAQQLQQMANNPKAQQQMQQKMQQAGMTQKQAQQASQLMKQAAQGNQQAAQQLQQMAQQAMQQMTPQQKQQAQQMMKQLQAQANAQMQAQQMQQAAQQMAQAMKQAQQQAGQQQMAQQPGGAPQQQQNQQMGQAMAQMQQQLQQMQAMKADAQQVAAAQQAAADAAADAAAGLNGGGKPGGQGQGGKWAGHNGKFGNNDNRDFKGPQNGMGGGGIGAGDRTYKEVAPYQVKEEISHSDDIDGGKILASTLIKAKTIKGESKVGAENVAPPPVQDQTDEIEQERISRQAQESVKKYFSAWQQDAEKQ
jgi:DNA segregation ATPase FtsK/SpoIIIE-like protein